MVNIELNMYIRETKINKRRYTRQDATIATIGRRGKQEQGVSTG